MNRKTGRTTWTDHEIHDEHSETIEVANEVSLDVEANTGTVPKTLKKKASFRAHVDDDGRKYYHCEVSDKVQWEEPEEHELKDFDRHLDSTSRRNYFVNRKTGRSTWTDHEEEELK